MEQIPVVAVVGPTASGKTALAVALAQRLNGEVISADSMQVYKGVPIGTAQPSFQERKGIPHHLIGVLDLSQEYNAAKYAETAREIISDIWKRGKLPVLAGGTGLYVSALLHNTCFLPEEEDLTLRKTLEEQVRREGSERLLQQLKALEPEAAEKIDPHNIKRVIRAVELCMKTGKTAAQRAQESHKEPSPYTVCALGLRFSDREVLYLRINQRVDEMIKSGLLEEAKNFFAASPSVTAMQAIGYKELLPYFNGEISLEDAVETIKRESRRYAKRQMTWFRREEFVFWLDVDQMSWEALQEEALRQIREQLPFLENRC